ncbi:MAG TPA: DUF502 domain-containing protein [Acidobacteriota bacterium]
MKLVGHFRRSLLTGLLIILPLVVTVWLFSLVLRPVQRFATPTVMALIRGAGLGGVLDIPGARAAAALIGLALTVVAIYLVGLAGSNIIGRSVVRKLDNLALSIPLVKSIYGSARQLIETFSNTAEHHFESVVLIEYPRHGAYAVGLISAHTGGEPAAKIGKGFVNVFVPTTPNPTSGVLVIARLDELVYLDMGVEEALRFVVSGGVVTPPGRSRIDVPVTALEP